MQYHPPVSRQLCTCSGGVEQAYIVEDVEIGVKRIAASCSGAVVGDLNGVVESVEIDAINEKRHDCCTAYT